MRRVIAIAVAGASLAGCSSFSGLDYFKSTPPPIQVQLESTPPGAEASTTAGPGCKTPCAITVKILRTPGDFLTPATTTVDPNPVVAELRPAAPPPRPPRKPMRPKKPKPPKAVAAPAAASPFPNPTAAPPPPPPPP